jgi:hypothetical protein
MNPTLRSGAMPFRIVLQTHTLAGLCGLEELSWRENVGRNVG